MITIVARGRNHLEPLATQLEQQGLLDVFCTMWPASKINVGSQLSLPYLYVGYYLVLRSFGYWDLAHRFSDYLFACHVNQWVSRRYEEDNKICELALAAYLRPLVVDASSSHPNHEIQVWEKAQAETGVRIGRLHYSKEVKRRLEVLPLPKKQCFVAPSYFSAKTYIDNGYLNVHVCAYPFRLDLDMGSSGYITDGEDVTKLRSDKVINIAVIGVVCPSKGIHKIIDALKKTSNPDRYCLNLYGRVENQKFTSFLKSLGFSNIMMHGYIEKPRLVERIKSSDIAICGSPSEGLPLSYIDCIQLSVPVFHTRESGLETLIGPSGMYDYEDGDKLAELLNSVSCYEILLSRQQAYLRQFDSGLNQEEYARFYLDIIKSAIDAN